MDFYVDEDFNPDVYWLEKAVGLREVDYTTEDVAIAENVYLKSGGRKVA